MKIVFKVTLTCRKTLTCREDKKTVFKKKLQSHNISGWIGTKIYFFIKFLLRPKLQI